LGMARLDVRFGYWGPRLSDVISLVRLSLFFIPA